MQDTGRGPGADRDWLKGPAAETGSDPEAELDAEADPEPCAERERAQRRSAGEKARIVREGFCPGERVDDVTQRYGLSSRQLSSWRTLAREGKLTLPPSAGPETESVAAISEPEPAFAALEVDPAPEPDRGAVGSVLIEARGVRVRLDGDIGAGRIAEIPSVPRALR